MKILYYCAHPLFSRNDPAGYATHIREVIKGFEQQGHTVAPLIMGEQGKPAETTANTGAAPPQSTVKTLIKKLVPTALWEYLKERKLTQFDGYAEAELRQLIAAFQPDLVYERACFAQDSGVKVLSEMDIPHFMEVNAPMVEEHQRLTGGKASKRAAVVERLQIEKPTRVVVVSTALRQYFSERFKIDSQKILVTPNAFQHEHITQEAYDSKDLANELGLENKLVLGFVGSIFRWHGLDQLIDAFATFQPDPDLRLLIVGNGDSMDELQTQAKELGLADRVIFTGSIKHAEVFQYINLMDICIMARSNWYGSLRKDFRIWRHEENHHCTRCGSSTRCDGGW